VKSRKPTHLFELLARVHTSLGKSMDLQAKLRRPIESTRKASVAVAALSALFFRKPTHLFELLARVHTKFRKKEQREPLLLHSLFSLKIRLHQSHGNTCNDVHSRESQAKESRQVYGPSIDPAVVSELLSLFSASSALPSRLALSSGQYRSVPHALYTQHV
jgi:DNA-binding response OmpR family regulator